MRNSTPTIKSKASGSWQEQMSRLFRALNERLNRWLGTSASDLISEGNHKNAWTGSIESRSWCAALVVFCQLVMTIIRGHYYEVRRRTEKDYSSRINAASITVTGAFVDSVIGKR